MLLTFMFSCIEHVDPLQVTSVYG